MEDNTRYERGVENLRKKNQILEIKSPYNQKIQ
jgi:hypothetical protein